MQIKELSLVGFCGFSDFTIDLADLTILTGPNNGGKSSAMRAIKLLLAAIKSVAPERQPGPPFQGVITNDSGGPNYLRVVLSTLVNEQGLRSFEDLLLKPKDKHGAGIKAKFTHDGRELACHLNCRPNGEGRVFFLEGDQWLLDATTPGTQMLTELLQLSCYLVRPVSLVVPSENVMGYQQFLDKSRGGGPERTWRNEIHWLFDGKDLSRQSRVVDRIFELTDGVRMLPPARGKGGKEVALQYSEGGRELDISNAGTGLLTVIYVVSVLELADDGIILIDEPDAHLHPTVQQKLGEYFLESATGGRQLIVATHSPDLIDVFPSSHLRWVDRNDSKARNCSDVGLFFADLGAVSRQQAVRLSNTEPIFVEHTVDAEAFTLIGRKLGKPDMRSRFITLRGSGDKKYLAGACRVLRRMAGSKFKCVGIFDSDYENPAGSSDECDGTLVIYLPCKELENLLLLQPSTLHRAALKAAKQRNKQMNELPLVPDLHKIEQKIDELTSCPEITKDVCLQHLVRHFDRSEKDWDVEYDRMKSKFDECWADPEYRRRHCPGKQILRGMRGWFQTDHSLHLGSTMCIFHEYVPDAEIKAVFEKIDKHFG